MTAASSFHLSPEDLRKLVKSQNADDRAVATHKMCRVMEKHDLSDQDRAAAQDIIRIMADDAAELVRRALAVTLRSSTLLPKEVALKLASDVTSVALPILSHCPIFSDEELSEIVRTGGAQRQIAIAKREKLSIMVTDHITQFGVEEAIVVACANEKAEFSDMGLGRTLDRFGKSEMVHAALINRTHLPMVVTERLIHFISQNLREQLISKHAISAKTATDLSQNTRERATLDMADHIGVSRDPKALVEHLLSQNRLTPSLLLRAIGRGQMSFFEHAFSILSGVPHERTWLMIHDAGPLGFRAIYERAAMPARLYDTFRAALETYKTMKREEGDLSPKLFQTRLIERFLTSGAPMPREDIIYLFERLDASSQDSHRASQKAMQEKIIPKKLIDENFNEKQAAYV